MNRVSREISILKKVRHKNVIHLFEVIDTPREIYLMMASIKIWEGLSERVGADVGTDVGAAVVDAAPALNSDSASPPA